MCNYIVRPGLLQALRNNLLHNNLSQQRPMISAADVNSLDRARLIGGAALPDPWRMLGKAPI